MTEPDGPDGPHEPSAPGWRRHLTPAAVVAVVLSLAVVVGVVLVLTGSVPDLGSDDDAADGPRDDRFAAYCAEVGDQQRALSDALSQGAAGGLLAALPSFEALADLAPRDIRDDWSVVVARVRALRDALDDAGLAPSDYDAYDPDDPPAGVDDAQAQAIATAATALAAPATVDALAAVEQQARDVCRTPLTL